MLDKTLIVGPSWVGDMVMAQTLFTSIRALSPNTIIDVLAPEWSRSLTQRMPEIDASIAMPLKHGELNLKARYKLGRQLCGKYQRCYVLPNSFKSALIPFWANIPQRIGWRGEWRYGLINDLRILNKARYPLMVQRYAALAYPKDQALPDALLRPNLVVNQQNVEAALIRYQLSLENGPIIVLCPGAEFGPSKRWPEVYFAEVSTHYLRLGYQIWILGSEKDKAVAKAIQEFTRASNKAQCIDLSGRTSLADAIDLMSAADLVVSNDSGLMHIAAALNRKLIAIYGSTDPSFTPPLNDMVKILQEKVDCSPCFKRVCPLQHHICMQKLSPQRIIHAMEALMDTESLCVF